MEAIASLIIGFLAGISQQVGACATPALDVSPPPPAPSVEFALPIRFGISPPSCPIGG